MPKEAELADLERAADATPHSFEIQYRLASSLRGLGQLPRAVGHYQCAVALQPSSFEVRLELGTLLRTLKRLDGSLAMLQRALELRPDSALAHLELGSVLMDRREPDDAIASFRRAISLDTRLVRARVTLASALAHTGLLDGAIRSMRDAAELAPTDSEIKSAIIFLSAYQSNATPQAILQEARDWQRQHGEPLRSRIRSHDNNAAPERRLRIGYVSPDFWSHPLALFLTPVLKHHDRERFEIFCYASVANPDGATAEMRSRANVWRDILPIDDEAAAEIVRQDRIDVLVDLTMHMADNRLRLFACKPAPVQVCWFAYPGTTGLEAMDYRLTDPFLDPPGFDDRYSERSIRLPETFWCYDPRTTDLTVGPLPALEGRGLTFGCLNNFTKVNAEVLSSWARVLRAIEGSRLIMQVPIGSARERTLEALEAGGVARSRVEFVGYLPRKDYLSLYRRVDVALDCLPYNGHTTSLDAFWMGVPTLTLVGQTVVGRAGLCYAMNLAMPEIVAHTADDYVKRAVDLCGDLTRLSDLRANLRSRIERSPLMDAPRFTRNMEHAFRSMWRDWCRGGSTGSR